MFPRTGIIRTVRCGTAGWQESRHSMPALRSRTVLQPPIASTYRADLQCTFNVKAPCIWSSPRPAGYFSYKWAEVLSADAFGAFEEAGLDNESAVVATGQRFR